MEPVFGRPHIPGLDQRPADQQRELLLDGIHLFLGRTVRHRYLSSARRGRLYLPAFFAGPQSQELIGVKRCSFLFKTRSWNIKNHGTHGGENETQITVPSGARER